MRCSILNSSIFTRCSVAFISAALFTACDGSQLPIGAPSAIAQSRAIAMHAGRGGSWMIHGARQRDLLYVTDRGTGYISVYSYPDDKLKGILVGFGDPQGECVDVSGNVYIVTQTYSRIYEFPHGGEKRIKRLSDPFGVPLGCSVDPRTGELAVTNGPNYYYSGNVVIYRHAQGKPVAYFDSDMYSMYFCSYDSNGDLFVDGAGNAQLAELASGSNQFKSITLDQTVENPGGLQWDGKQIAIASATNDDSTVYRLDVSGTEGRIVGSTSLAGADYLFDFWIQQRTIIGADDKDGSVKYWSYPRGGQPVTMLEGFSIPIGVVVSRRAARF